MEPEVISMVMSKDVLMLKEAEKEGVEVEPGAVPVKYQKFYTKSGVLSARTKKIKDRIMEFLDTQDIPSTYSDIKKYLYEKYPSDYIKDGVGEFTNYDIKHLCQLLVEDDLVVD